MSSLLKGGTVLLVSACFAAPGFAQSTARAEAITAPVKDAGILRLATGTWDRTPQSALALGAEILFNHNAPSGYYNPQGATQEQVGEGRIPSLSSEGYADDYDISCWQTAYCTSQVQGADITIAGRWFEQYNTCNDPDLDGGPGAGAPAVEVGNNTATGLPGTAVIGTQSCWIVTIDMAGTPDVFNIAGDGNGMLDGIQDFDDFGWGLHMSVTSGLTLPASTGLILTGDPLNAPFGDGLDAQFTGGWVAGPGVDGTGLDELDQFFIGDSTDASFNGCYWFGGYVNNHIWGGHWHQLLGNEGSGTFSNYCSSTVNSTGSASVISASGSGSISANDLVLSANNLPSQPGIFIAGPNQQAAPFYCGFLCVGFTGLQRFANTAAPAGGVITEAVDYGTSAPGGLNVVAGSSYNYQRWNRDPAGAMTCAGPGTPNNTANFSDAVEVAHTP